MSAHPDEHLRVPCDTPERLAHLGPSLSPQEHADAVRAWTALRDENAGLRAELRNAGIAASMMPRNGRTYLATCQNCADKGCMDYGELMEPCCEWEDAGAGERGDR